MDEDMMGMQVNPVMMPEQPTMQGTPAPQQIIKILQQMVSQGAGDEEIEAFLQQVGITMEELQQAREMFGI